MKSEKDTSDAGVEPWWQVVLGGMFVAFLFYAANIITPGLRFWDLP
mgnify:CR=1 FL=1